MIKAKGKSKKAKGKKPQSHIKLKWLSALFPFTFLLLPCLLNVGHKKRRLLAFHLQHPLPPPPACLLRQPTRFLFGTSSKDLIQIILQKKKMS